jgi:hypothetical protein
MMHDGVNTKTVQLTQASRSQEVHDICYKKMGVDTKNQGEQNTNLVSPGKPVITRWPTSNAGNKNIPI